MVVNTVQCLWCYLWDTCSYASLCCGCQPAVPVEQDRNGSLSLPVYLLITEAVCLCLSLSLCCSVWTCWQILPSSRNPASLVFLTPECTWRHCPEYPRQRHNWSVMMIGNDDSVCTKLSFNAANLDWPLRVILVIYFLHCDSSFWVDKAGWCVCRALCCRRSSGATPPLRWLAVTWVIVAVPS